MKYEVRLVEKEIYVIDDIEADTASDAIDKAYELISTEEGKAMHHSDSDGDYDVIENDDE